MELSKEKILEAIPLNGILLRSLLDNLGVSLDDKPKAIRVLKLLKQLEKEGKIRDENKNYFLIGKKEIQKDLQDFTVSKKTTKISTLEKPIKKRVSKKLEKETVEETAEQKSKEEIKGKPKKIAKSKSKSLSVTTEESPQSDSLIEAEQITKKIEKKPKRIKKSASDETISESVVQPVEKKPKKVRKPASNEIESESVVQAIEKKPKRVTKPTSNEINSESVASPIERKQKSIKRPVSGKVETTKKVTIKPKVDKMEVEPGKKKRKPSANLSLEAVTPSSEEETEAEDLSKGVIRQGSIAEFMRKRTQLVGFDIGFHKHIQFCAEFLDNSLDGIESFNWKFPKRFKLKSTLEKSTLDKIQSDYQAQIESLESSQYEITRKTTIESFDKFIEPIKEIIDREPLIIVRIREIEKPKMLPEEMDGKDIRMFCFEILDNGIGIVPSDLEMFGLYLASSKSANLKQTRGSQGFGASSAFSDSQNTTGRPIAVVSRHETSSDATLSVFYTTSKNQKEYALGPENFRTKMQHGTYVRLFYLNVRYIRGYADQYIEQASFLNGHVTLIFIDPYGEVSIYPRQVTSFPNEPTYAQPHPASVQIGEFQELLRSSNSPDITSFLAESFVRMSKPHAKQIVEKANQALGGAQNILATPLSELSETANRALYRNLTQKVVCINKNSPEELLKIVKSYENEKIIKIFSQFYDYIKEKFNPIVTKLNLENQKSEEITKEDIKNIQESYRETYFCPYSISFAKFKSFLKEYESNLFDILSSDFCNLDQSTIKKLVLRADKILNYRNLNSLIVDDLNKKEIKTIFEIINKNVENIETDFTQFETLIIDSKGKNPITIVKRIKGIKPKILENIISSVNEQLGYKSLGESSTKDLTEKEIKSIYNELGSLEKCPSSITINNFTDMLKNSKTKSLSSFISQNFIGLKKEEIEEIIDNTNKSLGGTESLELIPPANLNEEQMNTLFKVFSSEKYLAPPTDTVVPVGSEDLINVIREHFEPAFVEAETRKPTSGKGLAFGIEVALAYGGQIRDANRAPDVLYRFVNRTPKLRDNSDCAIWKATSEVNWKNYKLETFDNGIPRGKVRILVNVSGPFVHVMFKSQSKQALAEDETLKREILLALEEVGRKLRSYLLQKEKKKQRARRASQLLQNVRIFAKSLYDILEADNELGKQTSVTEIEKLMSEPIKKDIRDDILNILSAEEWSSLDDVLEDLGLSEMREKWVIDDLIHPILNDLLSQNLILKEIREEIIDEEVAGDEEAEKKKVKKKKIEFYKLYSEIEVIESSPEQITKK